MDFEKQILDKMDTMNESLTTLNERMTAFEGRVEKALAETNGKLKGNHDLITKEFNSYVDKDKCEILRVTQGERIGNIEERLTAMEVKVHSHFSEEKEHKNQTSTMFVTWIPGIVKIIAIVGGILLALAQGWIPLGG